MDAPHSAHPTPPASPGGMVEAIVEFCRFLRTRGFSTGTHDSLAALQAARVVSLYDREVFRCALKTVLCISKEEWDLFDSLFHAFWNSSNRDPRPVEEDQKRPPRPDAKKGPDANALAMLMGHAPGALSREEDGGRAVSGASVQERLKKTDFSKAAPSDLEALEKIALRLLKQMSLRLSRRFRAAYAPGKVDLRRTIRLNLSQGGEPVQLRYKSRKPRPSRLVLLIDISGSMNPYSLFLVRFAYALQRHFERVHTFLFSTRTVDITRALRRQDLADALHALSQEAAGWSGGTRIGESLREWNQVHGKKLFSRDTLFIILSDGWDTGDPATLAGELAQIKRRCRRLIWLNPLLGIEGYQPVTRGMSAALPHIDLFAPAHNLESLLELERHLRQNTVR